MSVLTGRDHVFEEDIILGRDSDEESTEPEVTTEVHPPDHIHNEDRQLVSYLASVSPEIVTVQFPRTLDLPPNTIRIPLSDDALMSTDGKHVAYVLVPSSIPITDIVSTIQAFCILAHVGKIPEKYVSGPVSPPGLWYIYHLK